MTQNSRRFPDDIFKWIFLNENVWISIEISLKFVPKGPINNVSASVQIMAWHQLSDKPLCEPIMVNLLTHLCITRSQWVKFLNQVNITRASSHPDDNQTRRSNTHLQCQDDVNITSINRLVDKPTTNNSEKLQQQQKKHNINLDWKK